MGPRVNYNLRNRAENKMSHRPTTRQRARPTAHASAAIGAPSLKKCQASSKGTRTLLLSARDQTFLIVGSAAALRARYAFEGGGTAGRGGMSGASRRSMGVSSDA